MLNKLQFNNLVISNKKGIQQARIQTINKLVHKIRKLKILSEKHPDNTKCKERVRKSTETMELLKKLKRVDVMKQVLLMDKPPTAVITNGLATPEEVGMALLAMNKVMQVLIKRFTTELKLEDKESGKWKEELKESSKRRLKIERTEEKRRKRIEMKEQKVIGRKRQEWIEQNNPGEEKEKLDSETNVSTIGKWKVEELEMEKKISTLSKKNEKKNLQDLKRPLKEKTAMKKKQVPNKKIKKEFVLAQVTVDKENHVSGEEVEQKTVQNIASHEESIIENHSSEEEAENEDIFNYDKDHSDDDHVEKEDPQDAAEEPEETLVVDPFFITDTGENYLSTAVIKRSQNVDGGNNEDKRDLHMIKLNSNKKPNDFRDRRQQSRNSNQQNFRDRNNQTRDRFSQNQNKWNNEGDRDHKYQQNKYSSQNDRNEKFQPNKWHTKDKDNNMLSRDSKNKKSNNSDEKTEQNLHPSWAAKQKLKPVISSFQGKKITFGDDDNINKNNDFGQPRSNTKKNLTLKPKTSDNDSLHPSWVAKQKLKPTITAFQGKKITFDNYD